VTGVTRSAWAKAGSDSAGSPAPGSQLTPGPPRRTEYCSTYNRGTYNRGTYNRGTYNRGTVPDAARLSRDLIGAGVCVLQMS